MKFYKMHGAGNDFVLLVAEKPGQLKLTADDIRRICKRHTGVGADGLMIISPSAEAGDGVHFELAYFNADGTAGEMCGNGARCAARLAHDLEIAPSRMSFRIYGEVYQAEICGPAAVKIAMHSPELMMDADDLSELTGPPFEQMEMMIVGVPHLVIACSEKVEDIDILKWGKYFREHRLFKPAGVNVNFAQPIEQNTLAVRIYERGVENETLACGTGAVATAVYAARRWEWSSPIAIQSAGGELQIHFDSHFKTIELMGPAVTVFTGALRELQF